MGDGSVEVGKEWRDRRGGGGREGAASQTLVLEGGVLSRGGS